MPTKTQIPGHQLHFSTINPNLTMAETAGVSTDSQGPQPTTDKSKTMEFILSTLRPVAKYKARSYETSKTVHLPLLESQTLDAPRRGPAVVLLGDSMFERMITTGQSINFVAPWPSPAMLDDETIARYEDDTLKRLDRVFNAGVGGDKIQNLAYRLVGDEERGLPGLLPALARCGTVRLWVLHVGTNNLSPKDGLKSEDLHALERLITAVLSVSPKEAGCKVLVTFLFPRKDIPNTAVVRANEQLKDLTKTLMGSCGVDRLNYLEAPVEVTPEEHLVDHVHLSLEGYKLWAERLYTWVVSMLDSVAEEER